MRRSLLACLLCCALAACGGNTASVADTGELRGFSDEELQRMIDETLGDQTSARIPAAVPWPASASSSIQP